MATDKPRWPHAQAWDVGSTLAWHLRDFCVPDRILICGSLRRGKPMVGDVEILYVPRSILIPAQDFFAAAAKCSAVDGALEAMIASGVLARRKNVNGSEMWGEKNKMGMHLASGIPVDFFAATMGNWANYLVCRTGGAVNNMMIATAAQKRGWKWNPYGEGFSRVSPAGTEVRRVKSEAEVFEFVGMKYLAPEDRK